MPYHHMVLPHYMGRSKERDIEDKNSGKQNDITRQNSFSSQSPMEDIPLLLPQEADGLAVPDLDQKLNSWHADHNNLLDQPNGGEVEALYSEKKIEGFVDHLNSTDQSRIELDMVEESGIPISDEWWENQEESKHNIAVGDCGQVGPRSACHCQVTT